MVPCGGFRDEGVHACGAGLALDLGVRVHIHASADVGRGVFRRRDEPFDLKGCVLGGGVGAFLGHVRRLRRRTRCGQHHRRYQRRQSPRQLSQRSDLAVVVIG